MGIDERTFRMEQEYMDLHEQGLSPSEIAKRFNLDVSTVYKSLGKIANSNGVDRADLLDRPHGEHVRYKGRLKKVEPLDPSDFLEHFEKTMSEVNELHVVIKRQIKAQERIANHVEEEEAKWTR